MNIKKQVQPKSEIQAIKNDWEDCIKCEIGKHVRNHVFLDTIPAGLEKVDVIFVGEGPGQIEDVTGKPFMGASGQLLRKAIADADTTCRICGGSGYSDEKEDDCEECLGHGYIRVGLLNLLACRPYSGKPMGTGNRPPIEEEVFNCLPRLVSLIKTLNPDFLFLAGKEVQSYIPVLREELASKDFVIGGFVPIKHPSALLRQGGIELGMLLYDQYVMQIKACFDQYFNGNKINAMQLVGLLPGTGREPRK